MSQTATKPKACRDRRQAIRQGGRAALAARSPTAPRSWSTPPIASRTCADRTTQLAADRTILAAERTYAAWVRTGLFALASGVGARALLTGLLPEWLIQADASMLIAFSVFCFGAAIWRHLNPGPPPPRPAVQQIPRSVLIVVNSFLALVSLAALIGIWTH